MEGRLVPDHLAERIQRMHGESVAAYCDYLEDGAQPYELQHPVRRKVHEFGSALLVVAGVKLAQAEGVKTRINFLDETTFQQCAVGKSAIVSYASEREDIRTGELLRRAMAPRKEAFKEVLMDFSGVCIIVAAAFRANAPIQEIYGRFPHLSGLAKTNLDTVYQQAQQVYRRNADLFFRLTLQNNLFPYIERPALALDEEIIGRQPDLIGLGGQGYLDYFDQSVTGELSEREYRHMRYRTVEDLVLAGYEPLAPEEYQMCLRELFFA